jgi:hypothetical protein
MYGLLYNMTTYTPVANLKYGNTELDKQRTGKCGYVSSSALKAACDIDNTCVAYTDNILNSERCIKHTIEGPNSTQTAADGYTTYIKDFSNCKVRKHSDNLVSAPGFCINNNNIANREAKNNIIKELESKSPKTLIISRDNNSGQIIHVFYSTQTPATGTQLLNFYSSSYPTSTAYPSYTIFQYFIISIAEEETYRFETYGATAAAMYVKIYVNGVPLEVVQSEGYINQSSGLARLTPGDYFICVEYKATESSHYLNAMGIQNMGKIATRTPSNYATISEYVVKPVNFFTIANSKYNEALSSACNANNYTTSEYCMNLIKTSPTLNENVLSTCLTKVDGNYIYSGGDVCSSVINSVMSKSPDVNSSLSSTIFKSVESWALSKMKTEVSLSSMTIEELAKLNSMFDKIREYNGVPPGLDSSDIRNQIVAYCEKKTGDDIGVANDGSFCGKIYNDANLVNYNNPLSSNNPILVKEIGDSKQKLKVNYCDSLDANGVKRYESDEKCLNEIKNKGWLNELVYNRCAPGGKWNIDDKYCNNLLDGVMKYQVDQTNPIKANPALGAKLKTAMDNFVPTETKDVKAIKANGGVLKSQGYITNYYSKDWQSGKPSELLNQDYLSYCLEADSTLDKTSCGPVFKAYSDNVNVLRSRARMRNKNCMSDKNLMTDLETQEAVDTNTNKCKTLATNGNIHNLFTFSDKVNEYCSTPENLAKEECGDYYQNAGNRYIKSLTTPTQVSAFTGSKERFENEGDAENEECWSGYFIYIILILIIVSIITSISIFSNKKIYNPIKRNNL